MNLSKENISENNRVTRDEQLMHYLEHTPTFEMLRDFSGKEPLSVDVKLAEKLNSNYNLPVGVVNVLLSYVYLRNDGKITNSYVERIASHWINRNVDTVKMALETSRNEHDQYVKWKNEGQIYKRGAGINKVVEARQKAIETAINDSGMTDEQLGKFVRNMFL